MFKFYFTSAGSQILGPAAAHEWANDFRALSKATEMARTPLAGAAFVEAWDGPGRSLT